MTRPQPIFTSVLRVDSSQSVRSLLKSAVIYAFLAIAGFIMAPASANARFCGPLFEKVHLAAELDRDYRLILKSAQSQKQSDSTISTVRTRLVVTMETALKRVTTSQELIEIHRTAEVYAQEGVTMQAVSSVDWLAPVRKNKSLLADGKLQSYFGSNAMNQGLREALMILLKPEHALKIVDEIIRDQQELLADYLNQGSNFNRSLMVSLETLPFNIRTEALRSIYEGVKAQDKNSARELQSLTLILLRTELLKTIDDLNVLTARNASSAEIYNRVGQYAKLRADGKIAYGLERVVEVAKLLQYELRDLLKGKESVELFGSFPSLLAQIGRSDIDMIFSLGLDSAYRTHIRGSMFSNDNFATRQPVSSPEANALSAQLLAAEARVREFFNTTQKPGELLTISNIPTTLVRGATMLEMTREEYLTFLTMVSPITVNISKNKITLRLYDSWGVPAGAEAIVHEYVLH